MRLIVAVTVVPFRRGVHPLWTERAILSVRASRTYSRVVPQVSAPGRPEHAPLATYLVSETIHFGPVGAADRGAQASR